MSTDQLIRFDGDQYVWTATGKPLTFDECEARQLDGTGRTAGPTTRIVTEQTATAVLRTMLGTDAYVAMTGGGCRAIIAGPLDNGAQVWITDGSGCHAVPDPTSEHNGEGTWMVGVYATEEAVLYGEGTLVESAPGATDLDALRATVRDALDRTAAEVSTVVERIRSEVLPVWGPDAFRADPGGLLAYHGFVESDAVCAVAIGRVLADSATA